MKRCSVLRRKNRRDLRGSTGRSAGEDFLRQPGNRRRVQPAHRKLFRNGGLRDIAVAAVDGIDVKRPVAGGGCEIGTGRTVRRSLLQNEDPLGGGGKKRL